MSKSISHERTRPHITGALIRTCDKYILYVYTCLRWGRLWLTDDECSQLFGGRSDLFAQLDSKWMSHFITRCRASYQREQIRCMTPWEEQFDPLSYVYRLRTGQGTCTTFDCKGRVVQMENFADNSQPLRMLSIGDGAFAVFEDTLSVFTNIAFRMVKCDRLSARPSLAICHHSDDFWESVLGGIFFDEQTCYFVKEQDIRGLKVESGCIFTSDGLSLYHVVASWKTDMCLIFDQGCRHDIVRTLCSLVIGDGNLGVEFTLKCVLPDGFQSLDLRNLHPLEATRPFTVTTPPEASIRASEAFAKQTRITPGCSPSIHSSGSSPEKYDSRKGLVTLRDMTNLPCGFCILAENKDVVILRHLLRDAVVIVPKRGLCDRAGEQEARLRFKTTSSDRSVVACPPRGCLMEWFPCDFSLLKVKSGVPGIPPAIISCEYTWDRDEDGQVAHKKHGFSREAPTLHVLTSSDYEQVLPTQFRSRSYLYCQSVCLLPGKLEIVAPQSLQFLGCVAIMYAFSVFNQLTCGDVESKHPVHLLVTRTLSLKEAQGLLLSYLCLTKSFSCSENSCFRFTVKCHSVLAELRKLVLVNPCVYPVLEGLGTISKEQIMYRELEDDILYTRDSLLQVQDVSRWRGGGNMEKDPSKAQSENNNNANESNSDEDSNDESDESGDDVNSENCYSSSTRRVRDANGEINVEERSRNATATKPKYTSDKTGQKSGMGSHPFHVEDDWEDHVVGNLSGLIRSLGPMVGQNVGHSVLFGLGRGHDSSFKWVAVGIRTLGLTNLKILRACGVFHSKCGHNRATLRIPSTNGTLVEPCWLGQPVVLADDLCVINSQEGLNDQLVDCSQGCTFQLNYSPRSRYNDETAVCSVTGPERAVMLGEMSRLERAICSDLAKGYEEQKLIHLFKTARLTQQTIFQVKLDVPPIDDPACREPLYTRSWLVSQSAREQSSCAPAMIGDGEYFPLIEIPKDAQGAEEDTLSYPLAEYNLNLRVKLPPHNPYSMARADRSCGECGSVYEASLDEAILLGHCARVSVTKGTEKNLDVSACLSWFYRSIHPCIPDMTVGDVMLDYEFILHGRGQLSPIYALLSHLTESCRVNSFPQYRLFTLTRHRGASVWTRGTDVPFFHTQRLRMNMIGAFLCSQDHRLAPLLSRCCYAEPLQPYEFEGSHCAQLLPRGDEEQLLLQAYSRTLGPVFEFERVEQFPCRVRTSLGDWSFLRLESRSTGSNDRSTRYPGTAVIHGYTIAFASESPVFYLRDRGPMVQKLESVAVIVENGSLYRTDVLKRDDPEWPSPDLIGVQQVIKCKPKKVVIDEMFMRCGPRDPLEAHPMNVRSWYELLSTQWAFKKAPPCSKDQEDWEHQCPVSESLTMLGKQYSSSQDHHITKWSCSAPPTSFAFPLLSTRCSDGSFTTPNRCIEIDSRAARLQEPDAWRGFDALCSRVLTCPKEKVWTRGLCKVLNKGLNAYNRHTMVPMAHLIVIVQPGEWHASPLRVYDRHAQGYDSKGRMMTQDCGSGSVVLHTEVCSASEFITALTSRMLSGEVHELLDIKCMRHGLYGYLQRAIAWFAGATGPFRSREITVFTPEADTNNADVLWTHTLHPGLDALKTSSTGYLVSCSQGCLDVQDGVTSALLEKSKQVIMVKSFGNLVLHSNSMSLTLATMKGEPGTHVILCTTRENAVQNGHSSKKVHVRCTSSLREYCRISGIPRGVRGPETWQRDLPWSKSSPEIFCRKLAQLKYRWECGRTEVVTEMLGQEHSFYSDPEISWLRCYDGKLIPREERFWLLVDYKQSFARLNSNSQDTTPNQPQSQPISQLPFETDSSSNEQDSRSSVSRDQDRDQRSKLPRGEQGAIKVPSEWRDRGLSAHFLLNSRLHIEFVVSEPENDGHIFFEPVHNPDFKDRIKLTESGKFVKYYKSHSFLSLMHDVSTVLYFGCGLRPVFVWGSTDVAGDRVLNLALSTLALANRLSPMAYPRFPRITIVVRKGRVEMLKVARDMARCIIVTYATGRQRHMKTHAPEYTFMELPQNLEQQVYPADDSKADKESVACGYFWPNRFISKHGLSAFATLTTLWPSLSLRGDVKHPTCSEDPRWIGLLVCLAEWEGRAGIADSTVPGALEALKGTGSLGFK